LKQHQPETAWLHGAVVREVRNPDTVEKVHEIAKYGLDPGRFEAKIRLWRRWSPLLPYIGMSQ